MSGKSIEEILEKMKLQKQEKENKESQIEKQEAGNNSKKTECSRLYIYTQNICQN